MTQQYVIFSKKLSALFLFFLLYAGGTPQSHASRARMGALGGEKIAWAYYNDPRNIFINPAYTNLNRDYVTFEWGSDYDGVEILPSKPKAQGGFFKGWGHFVGGFFLGRDSGSLERINIDAGDPPNFLFPDNSIELFIGGDAGVEWGASVEITDTQEVTSGISKTQSSLKINLGVLSGPYEPYVRFTIYDKSQGGETAKEGFKSMLGTVVGMNYFYERFVIHGEISKNGHEYYRPLDGGRENLLESSQMNLGAGITRLLNDLAKMYIDLTFYSNKNYLATRLTDQNQTTHNRSSSWNLPITMGVEIQAKDFLTLRASLSQDIVSRKKMPLNTQTSSKNSTAINTGIGFNFDKLKIDGLVGTTGTKGEKDEKVGVLSLNNLLVQVGLTYNF